MPTAWWRPQSRPGGGRSVAIVTSVVGSRSRGLVEAAVSADQQAVRGPSCKYAKVPTRPQTREKQPFTLGESCEILMKQQKETDQADGDDTTSNLGESYEILLTTRQQETDQADGGETSGTPNLIKPPLQSPGPSPQQCQINKDGADWNSAAHAA